MDRFQTKKATEKTPFKNLLAFAILLLQTSLTPLILAL